jgi:hypothetical protein
MKTSIKAARHRLLIDAIQRILVGLDRLVTWFPESWIKWRQRPFLFGIVLFWFAAVIQHRLPGFAVDDLFFFGICVHYVFDNRYQKQANQLRSGSL